jgi:hypothetical protein
MLTRHRAALDSPLRYPEIEPDSGELGGRDVPYVTPPAISERLPVSIGFLPALWLYDAKERSYSLFPMIMKTVRAIEKA